GTGRNPSAVHVGPSHAFGASTSQWPRGGALGVIGALGGKAAPPGAADDPGPGACSPAYTTAASPNRSSPSTGSTRRDAWTSRKNVGTATATREPAMANAIAIS